ncbi:DUF4381 domain-containing protein [Roseibium sp. Sym1]|uniref:DUF4381 domain-containing protein n=1 Tax=Roseibium sp. Sym1 TaxID=3016006 RepID=UPI0022B52159|nr:DUF4381 domain-containing protein [Roseibium sp. Sym1]
MSEKPPEHATLVELLNRLTEPIDPPPISMMPQTWGWAALGGLLLLALLSLAIRAYRHHRANAYRREALAKLKAASNDPARIALILRRAALAAYPRRDVAGLTGQSWLAFLNRTGRGVLFEGAPGRLLLKAPYRAAQRVPELEKLAERWIRSHRREDRT